MTPPTRVLVADDDPFVLDVVADALSHRGAEVVRAADGGELIERLALHGPFDLIVTDVSMPWMNGLQAIRSTRLAGIDAPVIVMSALADPRIPSQVRALGTKAVLLRKPFAMKDLDALVSTLLERRGRAETNRTNVEGEAS